MTAGKFTLCYNALKVRSHYDAGGAPARDQASTGMNRGHTGMNRFSTGINRRRPGTTGAALVKPRVTGKDRQRPAWHCEQPELHRYGTIALPGPKQTPAELRGAW
ncbi:hypothetical protein DPMN_109211 [Dreissena polymorpha]|uniref:Uncharacterized protein n=1 Tax=Dreissena polymorpha TaxID=45954 RepID=A0A9D4QMS3_DREPO|nr:hypothetical protein DPMN_109211 [Dreissena polymorpha]